MEIKIQKEDKKAQEAQDAKVCSNPNCHHRGDEHFSPLRPKSSGDLLDTSCTLCECEKFEN